MHSFRRMSRHDSPKQESVGSSRVARLLISVPLGLLGLSVMAVNPALGAGPASTQSSTSPVQLAKPYGQSFTYLQAGFSQSVFGNYSGFNGFNGVAFTPSGSVWVAGSFGQSNLGLVLFDKSSTYSQNGTILHTATPVGSAVCAGLTNGPGGVLYTAGGSGMNVVNASTGAFIKTIGPPGNCFGIAVDPQTGNVVYANSSQTGVYSVNPSTGNYKTFAKINFFSDGLAFDPTGNYLLLANQTEGKLTIINRHGVIVQSILADNPQPDGIAFHATNPPFAVTGNTDGTMTRWDFPGNDYTKAPTQSIFASGGFYNDHSSVGSDGCLYQSQEGTRYDDGTVDGAPSVVRICGGFAPAVGELPMTLVSSGSQSGDDVVFHLAFQNQGATTIHSASITNAVSGQAPFDGARGGRCGHSYSIKAATATFCVANSKTNLNAGVGGRVSVVEDVGTLSPGQVLHNCATLQWIGANKAAQQAKSCTSVTIH